jgi:LCP family protein required for cell wall assembly
MGLQMRKLAILSGAFLLALVVGVGSLAHFKHQSPVQVLVQPVIPFIPSPEQTFGKDHLLVLVVGLDYDYDQSDNETSKTSRSDMIKAINLDFATNKAYVLSVPRDMDVTLPDGQEARINQAQSEGGIRESQDVVASWLGIPGFDRYVLLRIDTMRDLIDALGGVDVAVKNSDALEGKGPNGPVDYDDSWGHLHVHLQPGIQHLNGEKAVGYARFRHDWCSDPCRILRQDQVIKAIVARFKGDRLNTFAHIAQLLGVMRRDVQTNFTPTEQLSIANAFSNMTPGAVRTAQVPYTDDKDVPVYGDVIVPDTVARARLVQTMLLDPPRPHIAVATATITATTPSSVRVDVRNGTRRAGLARRVAGLLKAKGFTIANVGNADANGVATTQLHTTVTAAGEKVREALGPTASNATIVADGTSDVILIVGQDLADTLGADSITQ